MFLGLLAFSFRLILLHFLLFLLVRLVAGQTAGRRVLEKLVSGGHLVVFIYFEGLVVDEVIALVEFALVALFIEMDRKRLIFVLVRHVDNIGHI